MGSTSDSEASRMKVKRERKRRNPALFTVCPSMVDIQRVFNGKGPVVK
jgi:hypothetical protein